MNLPKGNQASKRDKSNTSLSDYLTKTSKKRFVLQTMEAAINHTRTQLSLKKIGYVSDGNLQERTSG